MSWCIVGTPLDILKGWQDKDDDRLRVSDWIDNLCERLDLLKDVAYSRSVKASNSRKYSYGKGKIDRQLKEGSLVWTRI